MCVAVHKPAGVPLPSWDTFENCFKNNPDGAGFCYPIRAKTGPNDRVIQIVKGLMTFDAFKRRLEKIEIATGGVGSLTNVDMFFHFRIGTHGLTRAASHTHPFPVVDDWDLLTSSQCTAEYAMMHNGILSDFAGSYNSRYSDTMNYVRTMLVPLSTEGARWPTMPATAALMKQWIGSSKIAIMSATGPSVRYGDWTEDKGCFYSNTTYRYTYYNYASYGKWDDAQDDLAYSAYWKTVPKTGMVTIKKPIQNTLNAPDYIDRLTMQLPLDSVDVHDFWKKGGFFKVLPEETFILEYDEHLQACKRTTPASTYLGKESAFELLVSHYASGHTWYGVPNFEQTEGYSTYSWSYIGRMKGTPWTPKKKPPKKEKGDA